MHSRVISMYHLLGSPVFEPRYLKSVNVKNIPPLPLPSEAENPDPPLPAEV